MRFLPAMAGLMAGLALSAPAGAESLAPYTWKDRVLLVFADGPTASLAEQRRRIDAARPALDERDMAVIAVIGPDRVEHWRGADRGGDAAALRARYHVPVDRAFAVLLVGKDGGTKWSTDQPTDLREVFGLIDTMPMRRQEMSRPG